MKSAAGFWGAGPRHSLVAVNSIQLEVLCVVLGDEWCVLSLNHPLDDSELGSSPTAVSRALPAPEAEPFIRLLSNGVSVRGRTRLIATALTLITYKHKLTASLFGSDQSLVSSS